MTVSEYKTAFLKADVTSLKINARLNKIQTLVESVLDGYFEKIIENDSSVVKCEDLLDIAREYIESTKKLLDDLQGQIAKIYSDLAVKKDFPLV